MRFLMLEHLTQKYEEGVWQLLLDADTEFVPPLSKRNSTSQTVLNGLKEADETEGPNLYFDQLKKQCFILALERDRVIGFLSYIHDHTVEFQNGTEPIRGEYISTVIAAKDMRRRGVTSKMYKLLLDNTATKPIVTRTWSQNHAHIHLLKKMGFKLLETRKDDRGPGIDTVYYGRG